MSCLNHSSVEIYWWVTCQLLVVWSIVSSINTIGTEVWMWCFQRWSECWYKHKEECVLGKQTQKSTALLSISLGPWFIFYCSLIVCSFDLPGTESLKRDPYQWRINQPIHTYFFFFFLRSGFRHIKEQEGHFVNFLCHMKGTENKGSSAPASQDTDCFLLPVFLQPLPDALAPNAPPQWGARCHGSR
jgi:hypothetical protein